MFTAVRSVDNDLIEPIQETAIEAKKQQKGERTISWDEKMLHGQFLQQTKKRGNKDWWQWLQNRTPKCETESLIFTAQKQAIRTNLIKWKTDKSQEQTKCRMCSRADKTISHIVSECSKLAQKEYKRRYKCQIIDFTIPYGTKIDDKEVKKIEKYLDLARKLKKVWNMKVTVVPLVVRAFCTLFLYLLGCHCFLSSGNSDKKWHFF